MHAAPWSTEVATPGNGWSCCATFVTGQSRPGCQIRRSWGVAALALATAPTHATQNVIAFVSRSAINSMRGQNAALEPGG